MVVVVWWDLVVIWLLVELGECLDKLVVEVLEFYFVVLVELMLIGYCGLVEVEMVVISYVDNFELLVWMVVKMLCVVLVL